MNTKKVTVKSEFNFDLNEAEIKSFKKFKSQQRRKYRKDGTFEFSFTPTSIGPVIKVKNKLSGDEKDISDYDSW